MIILYIVLGCLIWYGIGLLGSSLAMAYMLDKYPGTDGSERQFGLFMALLGVFNIVSATMFLAYHSRFCGLNWQWLKRSRNDEEDN